MAFQATLAEAFTYQQAVTVCPEEPSAICTHKKNKYSALPQFKARGEHPGYFTYSNTTKTLYDSTFWPLCCKPTPVLAAGSITKRIRVPDCPAYHTRDTPSHHNQSSVLSALLKGQYINRISYTFNTSQTGQVFLVVSEGTFGRCGSSHLGAAGTCIPLRAGACALTSFSTPAQVHLLANILQWTTKHAKMTNASEVWGKGGLQAHKKMLKVAGETVHLLSLLRQSILSINSCWVW